MEKENLVQRAREVALEALKEDVRSDGTPFFGHPEAVARIVSDEIGLSAECVAAVYLHEATRFHRDADISAFPAEVLKMVEGLNRISTIKPKDTRLEAENYKKLIVQYSTDPRVAVIKIADRLEIMRSLSIFPKASREQKILETLMLYIPLSHQLGLYNIKREMEDIYLRYAEPEQYRSITNKLKATRKDREKLTADFIRPLEKKLSDAGIVYQLKIRTKSAYSIYSKMLKQGVGFDGVFDVFAIRFIIDCPEDRKTEQDLCWKVYSYVTEEYKADTTRLRDWITMPKPNGYSSLHITVEDAGGRFLEVQIRTRRMDEIAENGNAAHWSYKGIRHEESTEQWLKTVRYTLEHPFETKPEDLPAPPAKEIFVFTPTGELKIFPAGSTVLDFAFGIHTGIGSRCSGALVNGRNVSIKHVLQTGDSVEIKTSKNQKPTRDWLSFVVTSKARQRIKVELAAGEKKNADAGRELLARKLRNWKLEFPDDLQGDYMRKHGYSSVITFMAEIAEGKVDVNDIKAFILDTAARREQQQAAAGQQKEEKLEFTAGGEDILVINAKNVKGIQYEMAHCCNPVFGDDVFGFVTRTSGIKIHRMSCPNAARLMEKYPYRIQKVKWQDTAASGEFLCSLSVTAEPDRAVIAEVTDVISKFRVSLRAFNVKDNQRDGTCLISIRLLVPSNTELDKVISQISVLRHVVKVRRV